MIKCKLTSGGVDEQTAEQKLHVVVAKVEGHRLGNNSGMLALHYLQLMLACEQFLMLLPSTLMQRVALTSPTPHHASMSSVVPILPSSSSTVVVSAGGVVIRGHGVMAVIHVAVVHVVHVV